MHNNGIKELIDNEQMLKDRIKSILSNYSRRVLPLEDLRASAVLLPLYWKDGMPHIVVTMRSMDVEHHKGEICFPGGSVEKNDTSIVETALREAHEEAGINKEDVEVLGLLDDHTSFVGYHITPVVGTVPYPYNFIINSESTTLLLAPLEKALSSSEWMAELHTRQNRSINVYYLEIDGGVVWGATARILKHFADLIAGYTIPFSCAVSSSARQWVMNLMDSQNNYNR